MTITGKVAYQSVGTGFWGIIGHDGKKWRPVDMPAALQKQGLEVTIEAEEVRNAVSLFMWGTAIKILSF